MTLVLELEESWNVSSRSSNILSNWAQIQSMCKVKVFYSKAKVQIKIVKSWLLASFAA